MYRVCCWTVLAWLMAWGIALAEPTLVIDNMEDLFAWRTGGQKEASLLPEKTLVRQGRQALRFEVKIDHQADESIEGHKYPKGWPRIERNPSPALDLSAAGGISFDIYTLSSRTAMPGSALNLILRDKSGNSWSANLGQLPLKQWKHFRLSFDSFPRSEIVHWQFFLSESAYADKDWAAFIIDDVQGYAAAQFRTLAPLLQEKMTVLDRLVAGGPPVSAATGLPALKADLLAVQQQVAAAGKLDFAACNALDQQCLGLLDRLQTTLLAVGAARTVSDASYCVGTESSARKILRDDLAFTPGADLRLSVAGNERESGQIVLRALARDLPRLDVEWTDLTGPGGAKLPQESVSLQAVGYVEVLKASYARDRDGWWPDPLLPLDWPGSGKQGLGPLAEAFAKVGETAPLWLTVSCPADAAPGLYTGTVTLKPTGLPESTVKLSVQVRNFSLPVRPRLKTAFAFFAGEYANYYRLKSVSADQRQAIEGFLLARKLDPMNLYTAYAWPPLEDVPFMEQRGLNAYCLGYCPDTVDKFGDLVYYHYLRDSRAWLADQGRDRDAWLYGYDEPHCRPDWEQLKGVMRDVYALVDAVAPDLPRASTTAIVPDLFGAVNLWIPQTGQVVRQDTLARQKAGDQVWTYVACTPPHPFANYFVEYAALEQRLLGWQTWQEQCSGFLYYATNLWRPNYQGQEKRWPDIAWNPRPEKDFAFNGDGLLIYPHPDGSLLSTVRLENIVDGFEDYDYLCLLRDAALALKATGRQTELVKQALAATVVPPELSASLTEFSHDPRVLLAQREKVGALLEKVKSALPAASWQKVLRTEPPLAPSAPKQAATGTLPLPFVCDFEKPGGMQPWTSEAKFGARASVDSVAGATGQAALATGSGKGWADWESPYLKVQPGGQYEIHLSAKPDFKRGLVRVFLFKYGAGRLPLDLPTRPQGQYAPALLGSLTSSGEWEKRRYRVAIPEGVETVRLYLQAFGLEGSVAYDDVSMNSYVPDPNLVDDLDDLGIWRTGFPEASATRETKVVRQGDAALRFTVKMDHHGGEEKYPIGWPSLTRSVAPPLNWTGKQALTFWVYATTNRDMLPKRAVNFTLRSTPGDSLSVPLTFPKDTWQQVRIPLAGKQLGSVDRLHFFVEEAAYQDKDWASFVLDDLRIE